MIVDNDFHIAPAGDYFANRIRATGSLCSKQHPEIYRCSSKTYCTSSVHNFVLGKRDFTKKIGDTCRMWVKFKSHDYLFYCWEGFYIDSKTFLFPEPTTLDGVVTCEHITRLVLTEKVRFKFFRERNTN